MLYFIAVFFVKDNEGVDMAVENIIIKGTDGTGDATKFEFASDHSGLSICCLICKI